jgi:uncharacterized lipoprotein YddW (UPF0748 family)
LRFNFLIFILLLKVHFIFSQEALPREFRGVWIATVGNIDWPSEKNLSTEQQKKEILNLLDLFHSLHFNAIIFQVRPAADAFYNSKYEPWSSYLTGENDKAPAPYYDPLAFIIEETHKRGMEFHAWLNPYRAVINYQEFQSKPFPLTYEKSEWFVNYGKNKYFNPGIPEVRAYTNQVVTDIVQNYNIDAIHFDDYFYPYKIKDEDFPDQLTFKDHGGSYYPDHLDDWRRNNINLIIRELYQTIKTIKPWVQLGISPFGVWRNKNQDPRGSATEAGQTNYDHLYADILYWIKNGWIDYILPQAYWPIGHNKVDYKEVVQWWADNSFGARLYIGHSMYRLGEIKEDPAWIKESPTEIEKQLDLNKSLSQIEGSVFFSAKSFIQNPFKIDHILETKYYPFPALQPIANKNVKYVPEAVINAELEKLKNKQFLLHWEAIPENVEKQAVKFLVYQFNDHEEVNLNKASNIISLTGENQLFIPKKDLKEATTFVIIGVSKNNDLSSPIRVEVKN